MSDTFAARTLRELMRVIFLRIGRILLMVIVFGGATYYLCTQMIPRYRSTVTLMFKQPAEKNPVFRDSSERSLEVFVKAQQQIVMSDLVMARTMVIAENPTLRKQWYDLRDRFESIRKKRALPSDPYDPAVGKEIVQIQSEIDEFLKKATTGSSTVADKVKSIMDTRQKDLLDFRDDVKLKTPGGEQVAMTESFQITVEQPGPPQPPDSYLNAMYASDVLADMYMVRFRELQSNLAGAADQFMKRVVDEHVKVINNASDRLNHFIENELDSPGDVGILEQLLKSGTEHGIQIIATRAREQTLDLNDKLAKAKSLRTLITGMLPKKAFDAGGVDAMTDDEISQSVAVVPPEVTENNIIVNRLTNRVLQVQAKLTNLQTIYTPQNNAVREAQEELVSTKRTLLKELIAHARSLDIAVKSYDERLAETGSELKNVEGRLDKINRKLTEYQRLKNDVTVAQKQHQDIQQEQLEAFVAAEQARAAVTIEKLDKASHPAKDRPAQPLKWLYTGIAAGVGLILAIALAFLADHFDHTFRTIDETERYLGLPVIGSVSRQGRTILTGA